MNIFLGFHKVYQTELEKVDKFRGFNDFILTFPITRGKTDDDEDEDDNVVGEFKVMMTIIMISKVTIMI